MESIILNKNYTLNNNVLSNDFLRRSFDARRRG